MARLPDPARPPNLQTDPEARKEKMNEILTDMTVRRDRLLKRFAVVLHGEYVSLGSLVNPLLIHPIVMAWVVDQERDFDLKVMYLVHPDLAEVGDEVPDEIFTAENHLAVLLDQFDIPHSKLVNGQVVRAPHPLPEHLYEGLETLLDKEPRFKR